HAARAERPHAAIGRQTAADDADTEAEALARVRQHPTRLGPDTRTRVDRGAGREQRPRDIRMAETRRKHERRLLVRLLERIGRRTERKQRFDGLELAA